MKKCTHILFILLALVMPVSCFAQEETNTVSVQGTRYVSFKIKSLEKYNGRLERQQKYLLNKLRKKEKRFANQLKKNDSLGYSKYRQQSLSYDSINKLSNADSGANMAGIAKKNNPTVDSLRKIQGFADCKSGLPANTATSTATAGEFNKLQAQLNFRTYINDLITKRTAYLKNLAASDPNVPGITGMEKQVFYGKAKMKVFKDMEEDPSVAEDKAMEYLQGTDGFGKAMSNPAAANSMQAAAENGSSTAQLEQMGYQTKNQMQQGLAGKFGGNLSGVTGQMGGTLKQWQQQQNSIISDLNSAKDTKKSIAQAGNTQKPSFKVNPMRGLPFWKRIEKQYSWQTSRASTTQPALFNAAAMAGYKQTPKLTYGVGIAYSEGLGQNWQHIYFSFQGIGYRTFAQWEWQYGIGVYAGYERMYKQSAFVTQKNSATDALQPTPHDNNTYTESLLAGLTKSYNLNTKYKGAIQVLYDFWWQQKGLPSPIVLRFVTVKK